MSRQAPQKKRLMAGVLGAALIGAVGAVIFGFSSCCGLRVVIGDVAKALGSRPSVEAVRHIAMSAGERALAMIQPPVHAEHMADLAAFPRADRLEFATTVAVNDTAELSDTFQRMGYSLDGLEAGAVEVPRLIVTKLPRDLPEIETPDLRKTLFFEVTLPLVLLANESILKQRDHIIELRARLDSGEAVTDPERRWLDEVEIHYNVDGDDFDRLLNRVDIIPPSLALAQAAIESGWGTSRYALEANALFGQYTTDSKAGLRPDALPDDAEIRVHSFNGLLEAVFSYAHNLNTHSAYREFRALRETQREMGDVPDGLALARTLTRYSMRGEDYVHDVRAVIRANELDVFDDAWLKGSEITRVVLGNT